MTKQEIDHVEQTYKIYVDGVSACKTNGDKQTGAWLFAKADAILDIMHDLGYSWHEEEGFKKRDE